MRLRLTRDPGLALTVPTEDQAKKVGEYLEKMDRIRGVSDGLKFGPQLVGVDWGILAGKVEYSKVSDGEDLISVTNVAYVKIGSFSADLLARITQHGP